MLISIFQFTGPALAEDGRAYYDLGVFAFENGDYRAAGINLEAALKLEPGNPYYNHFMGKTYLQTERYREAGLYFGKARQVNPEIPGLKYDSAYLEYKIGEYSSAAKSFKTLAKEDPSNILAGYYSGICLFYIQRHEEALGYFLETGKKCLSTRTNAWYYAGVCYRKIEKIDKAIEKFKYVRSHAEPGPLRDNAEKWLRVLTEEKREKNPLSLHFRLGYQYDDNVMFQAPGQADESADEDDFAVTADFSGTYRFIKTKTLKVGAGYNHYQSWHNDLDRYDIMASIPEFFVKYRIESVTLGFTYNPSYYWIDSESYLRRHRLRPEISLRMADNFLARIALGYNDDSNFFDSDRDGHSTDVLADFSYGFPGGHGYLHGGAGYEQNTASHSDYDYSQWKTKLGVYLHLPWKVNAGLSGMYYIKNWENADSSYGVEREDDKYVLSVSISRELRPDWLSVLVEFDYTDNDSNIVNYSCENRTNSI